MSNEDMANPSFFYLPENKAKSDEIYLLRETVSRDFWFQVFLWISFPQAYDYTIRAVSNFFVNVVDTGGKFGAGIVTLVWEICHRYQ